MKKKQIQNLIVEYIILFLIGGSIYYGIEFLWKTYVSNGICHWSMFLLGGLCFIIIGNINEDIPWEESIIAQCADGAIIITSLEFIFGYVLNIIFHLNIWDYSNMPLNIMGQICVPFMIAWFFLSLIAIVLDDVIRWKLFKEEKPHYYLKTRKMGEP